jgi:CubicO group peptidase (beta-lactamase class C family)
MTSEMARRLIPGAAVVVVRNGVVVRSSTYGLASLELGVPVTSRTLFQVASVTKNMTGVAIMQLVDSGAFALDDRVATRLDGLPAAWGPVTIRQLLSHTSGLPDMIVDPEKGTWLPGSRDSVLAQLAQMPVTPAGTAWAYNQTNYMLLGMLIDKYARRPYVAHIRDRVLAPLGVTGVVFGDSRTVATGRTTEYSRLGIPATASKLTDLRAFHYEYPDALLTAAGIFMHAEDLGRWLVALSRRAGLSRDAFEAMTTATSLSDGKPFHFPGSTMGYGLGWIVVDAPPRRAFGGSGGGRAALFVYPDEGLAVGVLTNLQGAGPESLVELVAGIYRDSK